MLDPLVVRGLVQVVCDAREDEGPHHALDPQLHQPDLLENEAISDEDIDGDPLSESDTPRREEPRGRSVIAAAEYIGVDAVVIHAIRSQAVAGVNKAAVATLSPKWGRAPTDHTPLDEAMTHNPCLF